MPVLVNGVEITDEQVFREMQHHPAASPTEAMQLAAQALVIRELLLQEAQTVGLAERGQSADSEMAANDPRIEKLLETAIQLPTPDNESCRRFYRNNPDKFTRNGTLVPFEDAREIIAQFLQSISWQIAVQQYLKILIGNANIAGIDLEGASSSLVQ